MRNKPGKAVAAIIVSVACAAYAQSMDNPDNGRIKIKSLANDFSISDLDNRSWKLARSVRVGKYWSGEAAPVGRAFTATVLWSKIALYVRFEANQTEPLIVSKAPDLSRKTLGLWDRDVCELFIAPDRDAPQKYFEFEIAPTGEWLDVAIQVAPKKRETDWEYRSGMESAARIEEGKVVMAIKVQWKALGKTPAVGDIWLGNLLRCVGTGPNRGYLAWEPTLTETPNFHVPERFGEFVFAK